MNTQHDAAEDKLPEKLFPDDVEYAGFYARFAASVVDSVALLLPISLILEAMFSSSTLQADREYMHSALRSAPSQQEALEIFQQQLMREGFLSQWFFTNTIPTLLIAGVTIALWYFFSGTPGKLLLGMKIVDAQTGQPPTMKQDIKRYLGYFLSMIGGMLGFISVVWDKRKQGWHDKLAGTVVVYKRSLPPRLASATRGKTLT